MNKVKYKDSLYNPREISDLRELLAESFETHADQAAFLYKDKKVGKFVPVTYSRFEKDINGLGTAFIDMGLKGEKIAVIGENSYPWVVTYFATVNGTGVIVPIDRELKALEVANLLSRAEVSAVVYSKKLTKTMNEVMKYEDAIKSIKHFIRMDLEEDEGYELSFKKLIAKGEKLIEEGDSRFKDAEIDKDAMTALLFTSGTTGLAKGVMLSHRNISANVYNMSKYVQIMEKGIGLSVLPMHHTYEMTCHIMTGLYQGMTLAICEGLKHIQENMAEIPANVMLAVPLIFEMMHKKIWKKVEKAGKADTLRKMVELSKKWKLYNHPWITKKIFGQIHEATGGAISLFIAGGAAINPTVIEDYQAMGFPMIQGYGMTENAPIIAVNKDRYSRPASVGLPMPGTEVKIVDEDENGIGEIICKGPSVMLGYYHNEEATAEAIRDGWLYTGDYGYMDKDGFLYVSGRKKSVIVTKNGKNIFPEEVEYYLSKSDYIEEVLVHGVDGPRNDDVIVKAEIYPNYQFIKDEKGDISHEELRALMQSIIDGVNENMPTYKRVKRFGIRETDFEKTTTRKIKRHLESNLNGGDQ